MSDKSHPLEQFRPETKEHSAKRVESETIIKKSDNKTQQRLEQQTSLKAVRLTRDPGNQFQIDMGDGKSISDKRKLQHADVEGTEHHQSKKDKPAHQHKGHTHKEHEEKQNAGTHQADTHHTNSKPPETKTDNSHHEIFKHQAQVDAPAVHSDKQVLSAHEPSLSDWLNHGGDTLARQVAQLTEGGGLMLLGPNDTMRGEAENYRDPDGCFPVFSHASGHDLHLYYGLHQFRKEYSPEVLAKLIREHCPPGRPIKLLGCESGVDKGIALKLAELLPEYKIYAPNGYCQLRDGVATVYKQKPSETYPNEPEQGAFILVKPPPKSNKN